jgi:HPr kinase/phosphorylase
VKTPVLTIQDLLNDAEYGLDLTLLAGDGGLSNAVGTPRIQKPGLALAGFTEHLHTDRIQILGNTEISFLRSLPEEASRRHLQELCAFPIICFVVTMALDPPEYLVRAVEKAGIPLLRTSHLTSTFISLLSKYLEDRLLPVTHVHGVLVDVLGVGVLLLGKSGIGKSECALDLILRGHRLVADDVVRIRKKMPATVVGSATEPLQFHMEIRGLGIINIRDLFGVSAIREKKMINLVIELVEWDAGQEYDRLGIDEEKYSILDAELRYLKIPVRHGRNMTSIIEVAARNFLLKGMGHNTAREFDEHLLERMEARSLSGEVE